MAECADIDECDMGIQFCRRLQCENTVGTYTCGCRSGFKKVVEGNDYACVDINECSSVNTCPMSSLCENFDGGYNCDCMDGFEGEACLDVDECSLQQDNCDSDAQCNNFPGGFECSCSEGFFGSGQKCERGQCQDAMCSENKKCLSPTQIKCICEDGFEPGLNSTCVDIDECEFNRNTCHEKAECTNLLGGFTCLCTSGYYGNGWFCFEGNCTDDKCPLNEECTTPRKNFKFVAEHFYSSNDYDQGYQLSCQ